MPIDCGTVIITDDLIKQVEEHKKYQEMLRTIERIGKQLEKEGVKIEKYDRNNSGHLVDYCVTLTNKCFFMWSLSPYWDSKEIEKTEEILNDKSNHVDTPPPPQKEDKEHNALVKDLTNMLSEGLAIKEVIRKDSDIFFNYNLILSDNFTRFVFNIKRSHIKKRDKLEAVIAEHHNPNLPKYTPPPPKKDAPFYQGMTKEEVRESIILQDFLHDVVTADIYKFGHVVVLAWGADSVDFTIELVRDINDNGRWFAMGENNPYYKELIQLESPAENIGGKVCELVGDKMEKESKELLGKVDEDIVNSLDKSGEDVDSLNDGVLAKDFDFAEYSKKMILAQHGLSGIITAQDLIQAAKDELIGDLTQVREVCSSLRLEEIIFVKRGFAECIRFIEQTLKDQPNVK